MSKIPCKKCKSCGVYHDLSVAVCSKCQCDLSGVAALLIETEDIAAELRGEINEGVSVFVQSCSYCGALNFISDKTKRVRLCYNCHKARVATVTPVEYVEEPPVEQIEAEPETQESDGNATVFVGDGDAGHWQGIYDNIKNSMGAADLEPALADDDDEDDDIPSWGNIIGGKKQLPDIALTAIRYGTLSFKIEAKSDAPYMLGRSANQSEFLNNDVRVSNEHCYIVMKNDEWYVVDNRSANGTFVNSKDIGLRGERVLKNGDELTLGHHPDSMSFIITIK